MKLDLSKREMRKVVMQTAESASAIKYTDRLVEKLDRTYAKEDLKHVADNATKLYTEERTQLPRLLEYF